MAMLKDLLKMGIFTEEQFKLVPFFFGMVKIHDRDTELWVAPSGNDEHPRFLVFDSKDPLGFATSIRLDKTDYDLYGVFKDKLDDEGKHVIQDYMDSFGWDGILPLNNNWEVALFQWNNSLKFHYEYAIIDIDGLTKPNYLGLPD